MQSSQSRSSRQRRGSYGEDDDGASSMLLPRDSLWTSPRADMREEKYSYHREDDEHRSGTSRSSFSPSKGQYRRGGRDSHDRKDAGSWTPAGDQHHSRHWRDDTGHPSAGRNDSRSEHVWATNRTDYRDTDTNQWSPDDERPSHREDRNRKRQNTNERPRDSGWAGRTEKRNTNNTREWRSDNGWEGRRRSVADEGSVQQSHIGTSDNTNRPQGEDRTWEPAASWKSNHRQGNNQNQNQGQGQNQKRQNHRNKGKKKKHNQQKKDWRAPDDSHLNNWTKREGPSNVNNFKGNTNNNNNNRNGFRRAQPRSPSRSRSRSRSRSPPESFYSRRSSPARSRSSDTVSRRRHESRYSSRRSRSPLASRSGGARRNERFTRSPPSSPAASWRAPSPDARGRPARRHFSSPSLSSRSRSRTRSRSVSRSPSERSRTVHRLPVATSVKDVQMNISKGSVARPNAQQPRVNAQKNGKEKHGKRDRKRQSSKGKESALSNRGSTTMPPPSLPVSVTEPRPSTSHSASKSTLRSPSPPKATTSVPRGISIRPGFRPIGQQSSALKRFFPGEDDDDNELILRPTSTAAAATTATTSSSRTTFVPATSEKPTVSSTQGSARNEWRNPLDPQPQDDRPTRSSVRTRSPSAVPMVVSPHPPQRSSRRPSVVNEVQEPLHEATPSPDNRPISPTAGPNDEVYAIVNQVGEGTFGKVYKAKNVITKNYVALKRIRMEAERDGFPVTAMREIKLLQSLSHENIVRLHEMMVANGSVFMVFEYMDHDLTGILSQTQFIFEHAHLKSLCRQMFSGLAYLHQKGVIHRDIKGSNILVNNRGELKLGDFGLARFYQKRRKSDYTNRVITLWYRPPELLLGTTVYGPEVDMWSAGCIMLELFTKKPVFQGNDEIHQLDVIYRLLGTPTPERWPDITSMPWYELVKPKEIIPNHFPELFHKWIPSQLGLSLAERLLNYDPTRRTTASQAFQDAYFSEDPPPMPPFGLSQLEGEWHELETKRERAKKRRKTEGGSTGPH